MIMAIKTVKIYKPRLWTRDLHDEYKRWRVIVAHRRSGKTVACLNHLIRDCIRGYRNDNELEKLREVYKRTGKDTQISGKYAYIAPTYKQAKNVAWDLLKEYATKVDGVKFNEAELRCDFRNGSRITLYGADNPDSLRGLALHGVVFDEYSQQPSNIFSEIIAPALADNKGYAIWIGTPKGKNEFYRLYEYACNPDEDESSDWKGMLLTVEDTDLIPQEELKSQRSIQTEDEYLQEWYCSFEAAIKGAYYAKELSNMRSGERITSVPYDRMSEVHTFWDIGMSDATSIGFFQITGQEYHMIDYYENSGEALDHYVIEIKKRGLDLGYNYGKHYLPHDIEVRELGTGVSRKEVLEKLGIRVNVVRNLNIADGINAGKLVMDKLWIDGKKCEKFIDAISQYRKRWNDKKGMFEEKPNHDWTSHAADMYRYFAVTVNNLAQSNKPREAYYPGRPNFKRR